MKASAVQLCKMSVGVFIAALLISELLLYAPGLTTSETFSVSLQESHGNVTGVDTVRATEVSHFQQTIYLQGDSVPITHLYYYYDRDYASSWAPASDWFGLSQHLAEVAAFRSLPLTITIVNATSLASLLSLAPVPGTALVMASGVFPDTVFSKTANLVTPWVQAGGTLVWVGDLIGYYSAVPGQPLTYPSPLNPGYNGTNEFINHSYMGGTGYDYLNVTPNSVDFGMNYLLALPGDCLNVTWVNTLNGVALGRVAGNYTNVAMIPTGMGSIVYFGGPTENVNELSLAIANIIESEVDLHPVVVVGNTTVIAQSSERVVRTFSFVVPPYPFGSGPTVVCSFVTQSDFLAQFASAACIPNTSQ